MDSSGISSSADCSWFLYSGNSVISWEMFSVTAGTAVNSIKASSSSTARSAIITLNPRAALGFFENPNYLFINLQIAHNAKAGVYRLEFTIGKKKTIYNYELKQRQPNSAERKGFGAQDVIYLIVPDRFANGDPNNDSHPEMIEKANRSKPGGRHGGDIQGLINNLDYINELGATTIWCTPLTADNEAQHSYHGYACSDYYKIDPRFGTNDLFKQLVDNAHAKGLKVIKDMVPNHCGAEHWWMQDLPSKDWVNQFPKYTQSSFQMATQSDPYASQFDLRACVNGWFAQSMPDMNLRNPLVVNYLAQMAIWWIEFAGLDGLRVDTYPYSDKYGVAEWTRRIMDEFPNLSITIEAWFHNAPMTAYWQADAPNKDGYNSHANVLMDFYFNDKIIEAINEQDSMGWGRGLLKLHEVLAQDFVYKDPFSMLIFAENHDMRRLTWRYGGDKEKVKRAYAILATMRGIPQIYQGTELLMQNKERQGDVHERLDMVGGWAGDPVNTFTNEGRTDDQRDVFNYIKTIYNWRRNSSAVHSGKLMQFIPVNDLYVYFRYDNSELVMTIVNNTSKEQKIDKARFAEILGLYSPVGKDIVSDAEVTLDDYSIADGKAAIVVFKK